MTRPFAFDMETSDPDDYITLLLLLGHPEVHLEAVTITPGTRAQVGLVRHALRLFGREDILVGAYNIDHDKDCVSAWHYNAYNGGKPFPDAEPDGEGWEVLQRVLRPESTLVTGAALKNLGAFLRRVQARDYKGRRPCFGRLYVQGGFAGEGVVPREHQLEKFKGKVTCPTFNLNGDPDSAERVLACRNYFSDLRFVSKNVCHGVKYDEDLHERYGALRPTWCADHSLCDCPCHKPGAYILHVMACCSPCGICGQNVTNAGRPTGRQALSQALIYQGMGYYLKKKSSGKAFHDPLAACCAIDPMVGYWAEVELYRERGEWGSYLYEGSGVRIITGYDRDTFLKTLLGV